jgi:hypothetical protein
MTITGRKQGKESKRIKANLKDNDEGEATHHDAVVEQIVVAVVVAERLEHRRRPR